MHSYYVSIMLRRDAMKQNGKAPICLQVFINKARKVISLGVDIEPPYFDQKARKVRIQGDKPRTEQINAILHKARSRAEDIFATAILNEVVLTPESFVEQFQQRHLQKNFIAFVKAEIEKLSDSRTSGTITTYKTFLKHLLAVKKDIHFGDINYELIEAFDRYMHRKGMATNTRWKNHTKFKTFIHQAQRKGFRMDDPYKNFPIQKAKTDRIFLEPPEIAHLLQLYAKGIFLEHYQRALRYFLFLCLSGMRDSDARRMAPENLIGTEMVYQPQKTQKSRMMHRLNLCTPALKMLGAPDSRTRFFEIPSQQKINSILKKIGHLAGLKKKLTTHVGRHTFATAFLTMGGQMPVLHNLLAHSKVETTMIYVHITPARKQEQVELLDKIYPKLLELNQ